MITLVIASDNRQLIDQVRAVLGAAKVASIVGEARKSREAVAMVSRRRPALLLLDLALAPATTSTLLADVRKRSPKTRVLAIDDRLDEERVLRAAKAGAHGYMLWEAIPAYLSKAVGVMAAGEAWFSRKLMGRLILELQRLVRLQKSPSRQR